MNSKKSEDLNALLKAFINRFYPDGLIKCSKAQLPKEIQENLDIIKPTLLKWEKNGYIKFNGKDDNFFEVLKEIN